MTAHKHAELMKLYAEDAAECERPWERWEYGYRQAPGYAVEEWISCAAHPTWGTACKYRRRRQKRELWQWAVEHHDRDWSQTSRYFASEDEARKACGAYRRVIRLDHTRIEVEE